MAFDASELESLKRADLQALAKRVGIKANGKVRFCCLDLMKTTNFGCLILSIDCRYYRRLA